MLIWIDIETTGLDPKKDKLLEVGIVLTTNDLEIKGTFNQIIYQGHNINEYMTPIVCKMHTQNGLIEESINSNMNIIDAEQALIKYIQPYVSGTESMCGSTVHFDRYFLKEHMKNFHNLFGYHNIDVSSIAELGKLWGYKDDRIECTKNHRGVDDCFTAIAALRYYKEHWFKLFRLGD